MPSERSISAEIALIWLAASAEVAASELWASRALLRIEAAVSAPTAVSVRSTSIASDLTWLAASVDAVTSVFCASRAPVVIDSAVALPAIESERCTSAASDLTWLDASGGRGDEGALGLAGAGRDRLGGGGSGDRQRTLHVGGRAT